MKRLLSTYFIFLFGISCFPLVAAAQVLVQPKALPLPEASNFSLDTLILPTSANQLGWLLQPDLQKTPIQWQGKSSEQYNRLFAAYKRQAAQPPIILQVKTHYFKEEAANGRVQGKHFLEVAFYAKKGLDTLYITEKTNEIAYQRSFSALSPANFERMITASFTEVMRYFDNWVALNANKHEAFTKKLVVNILPPLQAADTDTLYYGVKPLDWSDFKGSPQRIGRYGASIFSSIAYTAEVTVKDNQLIANVTPKVYMVRGMSWVLPSQTNSYALAHEALHFSIAQVAMNRYLKRLQAATYLPTVADVQSFIQYEYIEAYREMNRLQKQYDDETSHGINTAAQQHWQQQVERWLQE